MKKQTLLLLAAAVLYPVAAEPGFAQRAGTPPVHLRQRADAPDVRAVTAVGGSEASKSGLGTSGEEHAVTVGRFCLRCHSDTARRGGLTLEAFDVTQPEMDAVTAEKMIRKLRAGMMPPARARRPDDATLEALVGYLETRVDSVAAENPNPGARTFQRLNRAEYARTVHDILGVSLDVSAFLPADTISAGFDNIADVQTLSATTMEGYLRAADAVARLTVGDPNAGPGDTTYKVPRTANQLRQAPGAPFGSRGGVAVEHTFIADGDYVFRVQLHPSPTGQLFGHTSEGEVVEISIDGERVAVVEIDPLMSQSDPEGMTLRTPPIQVKAGPRRIAAVFIPRFDGPVDDLLAPIEHSLADTQIGFLGYGITTVPHLRDFTVSGPYDVTGVSETPTRRRLFTCRPLGPDEELSCAESIISRVATRAYRRPLTARDVEGLMGFYRAGTAGADFETGVRTALQAILSSPHFLFRLERASSVSAGLERISDLDVASRLSYFLWAAAPDPELIEVAAAGRLTTPAALDEQIARLLAHPRAESLATRFAAQWFRLQDLEKIHPDALAYPQYDQTLARSMRRETELLFRHLVELDGSILELLTADYTFVDERLARHYGIPDVVGPEFRRVEVTDPNRRGLLGHGSFLASTSHANRTSPVLRGKWVMEVLLGSPPPPPPPDVPDLEETGTVVGMRELTVREQLEEHRRNPACQSCHRVIDPIGLALENFDVTGAWRARDRGEWVDPTGELYDGTTLNGPADLRAALVARADVFLHTFAENLLAYGLGRRVEYHDMPTVRAIVREAEQSDYRISAFVRGVIHSDAFRKRAAPDTEVAGGHDIFEDQGVR
jgi:hypothetical protein